MKNVNLIKYVNENESCYTYKNKRLLVLIINIACNINY